MIPGGPQGPRASPKERRRLEEQKAKEAASVAWRKLKKKYNEGAEGERLRRNWKSGENNVVENNGAHNKKEEIAFKEIPMDSEGYML